MLYSILISFFEWRINDISYAEIITVLFVFYTLYDKTDFKYRFETPLIFLIIFVLWIFINNLFHSSNYYFADSSYWNNILRLIFYAIGFYLITKYLRSDINLYRIMLGLKLVLIAICILGLIELAFSFINIDLNFYLYDNTRNTFTGIIRPTSIFSEPAHFSIFISISLFLLIRYYYLYKRLMEINKLVYLVSITLLGTLSFIGYTFFLFLLFYYLFLTRFEKKRKPIQIYLPLVLMFVLIFLGLNNTLFFSEHILDRTQNIFRGTDTSSSHRILGAIEIIGLVKDKNLFTGIGLGQIIPYYSSFKINLQHFWFQEGNVGINNMLTYITVETGIIGLVLFLLFILSYTKKQIIYFIVFIIFSFSWGFFNTPFFWFYIYISKALIEKKKDLYENRNHNLRIL